MPRITKTNVDEIFKYYPPTEEQKEAYNIINNASKAYAKALLVACPEGRELSIALTHVQEARMMANASLALSEVKD